MKYWAYIDNEILGPYEKEKLIQLPGFTPSVLVCPQTPVGEKTEEWKEASTFPEIVALLNIPTAQTSPSPESPPASAETPADASVSQESKKISHLTPKPLTPTSLAGDAKSTELEPAKHEESQIKRIADKSFDPLTLSQIGKRLEAVKKDEKPVELPEDFSLSKPFFKKAPSPEPAPQAAPETPSIITPEQAQQQMEQIPQPGRPEVPSSAPEQPQLPEQMFKSVPIEKKQEPVSVSSTPVVGIDPMMLSQINKTLQDVINSGILKQDFHEQIKFIVQKIGHIEEEISMLQKSVFQKEIFDKISRLENSINEIKTKIVEKSVSATPPAFTSAPVSSPDALVSPGLVQPAPSKKEEVPVSKTGESEKKDEIQDQGEKAKSPVGSVFKKLLKVVIVLVLTLGIFGVVAFILKQMNIIDVTNIIEIPFISKPEKTETFTKPETEPKPQAEFSQEAVDMVREYLLKPGGDKLEIIINKEANKLKTDINFGEWKTAKISEDIYNVTILMPYNNGQSKLIYSFEVDFKNKVIKPLDEETKKLFEMDKVPQETQQQVTQQKQVQKPALKQPRRRRSRRTPGKQQVQPSRQKQSQQKPVEQKPVQKPAEDDEEYEYEYVEEDADSGAGEVIEDTSAEEEYMVPGVPKR